MNKVWNDFGLNATTKMMVTTSMMQHAAIANQVVAASRVCQLVKQIVSGLVRGCNQNINNVICACESHGFTSYRTLRHPFSFVGLYEWVAKHRK
eukprot:4506460-Amphidinium_carterae.1